MNVLKVNDMHCGKCIERITNAFNAAGLTFQVKLEDKTVSVEGGEKEVAKAKEELDDLGFEEISSLSDD